MRLKPQTYALTALTHQRRRIFQRTTNAELFIATLFRYRDSGKFHLHAFAVMPDHVHVLLTPAPDQTIDRCAQLIKGGFFSPSARNSQAKSGKWATTHTVSSMKMISATKLST